jgi:pimeloyl-ACP methyl ester carboxylesterase
MKYVLVHGSMHGAWCWSRFTDCLRSRGIDSVAVELPGHGTRVDELATLESYRDAVIDVVDQGDILVGHSLGGHVVTVAADAVLDRIGGLVYLAAGVPEEGKSIADVASSLGDIGLDRHLDLVETAANGQCVIMRDVDSTAECFYHDCSAADQRWAFEHLTPQPLAPWAEPIHLARFWESTVPRSYIACAEDHLFPPEVDRLFMDRLGVESPVVMNTSHSPFLSRPAELADVLELCRSQW